MEQQPVCEDDSVSFISKLGEKKKDTDYKFFSTLGFTLSDVVINNSS